jgi:sugar phosphate isomerase/epimerase
MIMINAPYQMVRENVRRIKELNVGVEAYFNNDTIDEVEEAHATETGKILRGEGIRCSVHAPFMDLSPGAVDRDVRRITKEKLKKAVTVANALGAMGIVCHPGYDRWRFGDYLYIWLEGSADTWKEVLGVAGDKLPVMLENVFEEEPLSFVELFRYMKPKNLYFCFDSGHFNLFTKVSLEV